MKRSTQPFVTPPMVVAVLAAAALAAQVAAPRNRPALLPIPSPELTGVEEAVALQLRQIREDLDTLIGDPDAAFSGLSETFGAMGQLYLLHELDEAASACFTNAERLAPKDFRWPYYLAVIQQRSRRLQEAEESLARALALAPLDVAARIRSAQVALAAGHVDRAEARFADLLEVDEAAAAAHYGLGQIALEGKDYAAAVGHFETTLSRQPQATATHYQLGLALRELGQIERAQEHLARFGRIPVSFADPLIDELSTKSAGAGAHIVRASRLRAGGDLEQSASQYRQALEVDPDQSASTPGARLDSGAER